MKKSRIAILLLMSLSAMTIFAQETAKNNKTKFNVGLKIGFHAATYNTTEFDIEGYKYDDKAIQSNKIGYSFSPFIRLSKGRSYFQTEAEFSVTRHNFEFEELATDIDPLSLSPEYRLTTYCIQVPILYGYNFVQNDTYGMSIFTGPKTKFIFTSHDKQEFRQFTIPHLHEDLRPITYYWEIGLGVNIANFFFDFVYDFGFTNQTDGIISTDTGTKYHAKRTDNILSFSVGIIL